MGMIGRGPHRRLPLGRSTSPLYTGAAHDWMQSPKKPRGRALLGPEAPSARRGGARSLAAVAIMAALAACARSPFVENAEGDVFPPPFCEFDVSFPEIPRYSLERLDGESYPRATIETDLYLLRAECAPRVNPATTPEVLARGYATQYPDAVVETVETAAGTTWRVIGSLEVGESRIRDEYHLIGGETSIMVLQTAGTEPRYPVRDVRNFIASLRRIGDDPPETAADAAGDTVEETVANATSPPAAPSAPPAETPPRPIERTAPPGLVVTPLDSSAAEVPLPEETTEEPPPATAQAEVAGSPPATGPQAGTGAVEPPISARPAIAAAAAPEVQAGPVSAARRVAMGPAEWAAPVGGQPPAAAEPPPVLPEPQAAARAPQLELPSPPAVEPPQPVPQPPAAASVAAAAPAAAVSTPEPAEPEEASATETDIADSPGTERNVPDTTAAAQAAECLWLGQSADALVPNLRLSDDSLVFLGDGSRPAGTLMGARAALLILGDENHLLRLDRDGVAHGTAAAADAARDSVTAGREIVIRVTGQDMSQTYRFGRQAFTGSGDTAGESCEAAPAAQEG